MIIFCAALSEYNQVLLEDYSQVCDANLFLRCRLDLSSSEPFGGVSPAFWIHYQLPVVQANDHSIVLK
jgi:hypothetical protein